MRLGIRLSAVVVVLLLLSIWTACGSGGSRTSNPDSTGGDGSGGGGTGGSPSASHVVVVMLENEDYASVIGSPQMPFLNGMATQNALATQFFANAHPSIGNYFMLTTGQNPTNNDDTWPGPFSGDNIARQLTAAGKTWKVYAESLPSVGYVGADVYPYIRHHNPFAYFQDVLNSPAQQANMVPFTQFATDLNANTLPNFAFVVPNNLDNGHDCPDGTQTCPLTVRLAAVDAWLSANLSSALQNTSFLNSSILIVTLDEAQTDDTDGGGHIPLIMAGASIKTGFQSTTTYQFPSVLKFTLSALGVTTAAPGAAATAPDMNEFVK
jgi:acid phosphatase